MLVGFGIAAPILILNFYLERVLMYSPLKSGLILMTLSLSGVVSVPLGSALAGKFGARIINFLGIILLAVGTIGLARIDTNTSILNIRLILIVLGFGMGFSVQSISSAIKYLPLEKSGMASGIINAGRQIGTCIGVAVLVSILNANVTNAVNNVKADMKYKINAESTLNTAIKDEMLIKVNNLKQDSNSFPKEDIVRNIDAEGKKLLDKTPQNKKELVLTNLQEQKSKVLSIVDYGQDVKNKEISKAFNNTFVVAYIVLFIFSVFGLFTDKKVKEEQHELVNDSKVKEEQL